MSLFRFFKKSQRFSLDPDGRVRSAYFVCTTHRSGSTLFCEALQSGGFGKPNEYIDDTLFPIWRKKWELPESADTLTYLREMVNRQTSSDGIFGAKIMWHQTDLLRRMLQPLVAADAPKTSLVALLSTAFPTTRFFWLQRDDKTAQAISLLRAQQTGRWHSVDTKGWIGVAPVAAAEKFDFEKIDSIRRDLIECDLQWDKFFKREELQVMNLVYEKFTARFEETLREAYAFLGKPASRWEKMPPPKHEKLADATSLAWAEQFRTMKAEDLSADSR